MKVFKICIWGYIGKLPKIIKIKEIFKIISSSFITLLHFHVSNATVINMPKSKIIPSQFSAFSMWNYLQFKDQWFSVYPKRSKRGKKLIPFVIILLHSIICYPFFLANTLASLSGWQSYHQPKFGFLQ